MHLLHEMTQKMDKNPRDFFEVAYDMRKIRRRVNYYEECNLPEKRWVEICKISERLRYIYNWPEFFKQGFKFKKPFIIDGHEFRSPPDMDGQVDENGKIIDEGELM